MARQTLLHVRHGVLSLRKFGCSQECPTLALISKLNLCDLIFGDVRRAEIGRKGAGRCTVVALNSRHPLSRKSNAELLLEFSEGAFDRTFVPFTAAAR